MSSVFVLPSVDASGEPVLLSGEEIIKRCDASLLFLDGVANATGPFSSDSNGVLMVTSQRLIWTVPASPPVSLDMADIASHAVAKRESIASPILTLRLVSAPPADADEAWAAEWAASCTRRAARGSAAPLSCSAQGEPSGLTFAFSTQDGAQEVFHTVSRVLAAVDAAAAAEAAAAVSENGEDDDGPTEAEAALMMARWDSLLTVPPHLQAMADDVDREQLSRAAAVAAAGAATAAGAAAGTGGQTEGQAGGWAEGARVGGSLDELLASGVQATMVTGDSDDDDDEDE